MVHLGEALTALGRFSEAEPLPQGAYATLHSSLGADTPNVRRAQSALLSLYEAWGKPALAARYRTETANGGSSPNR